MIRALQALSIVALVSAGIVSVLCADQWLDRTPNADVRRGLSVVQEFKQAAGRSKKSEQTVSPLIKQAEAFALYLHPPKPPPPIRKSAAAKSDLRQSVSVVKPPATTPKFTLLGTSYDRARPGESLALVSEAGREACWVKQGAHLGHFIVTEVKSGRIIYRQGERVGKMAVNIKARVHAEQPVQTTVASGKTNTARPEGSTAEKVKAEPHRPMHKLGPRRREIHIVAYDRGTTDG
jgi:hypothetical protein